MTAQRRNIYDKDTLDQFLKYIPSQEHLDLLYLLTYADMSAVTFGFLNSWKLNLLNELYKIASEALQQPHRPSEAEDYHRALEELQMKVFVFIDEENIDFLSKDYVTRFLYGMPLSYLKYATCQKVINDTQLLMDLSDKAVTVSVLNEEDKPYSEITICSRNIRGLFSMLTSVFIANGININGASIVSSSKDWVIDTLHVDTIKKGAQLSTKLKNKIIEDVTGIIEGKITRFELFKNRRKYIKIKNFENVKSPTKIDIDNITSDKFTIVEIIIEDRPGVLFVLTNVLYEMGLDINSCYLALEANRAIDTFYITRDGQKVEESDFESKLRSKLASLKDEDFK
ncbi:MAG: hypothetical protein HQK84_10340 [Nitrospinae bacterium]|nr:hypothetical protein [Nitrospinota bacterium]